MSKIDESGPAFPLDSNQFGAVLGMSLRDYFAAGFAQAQATATSADSGYLIPDYVDPRGEESVAQKIARISYALADAMLAARSQP
ncbi:hypothetical protein [Pseudomonas sp. URMO17WK12:I12]|uniref:hypothetical protein n=1 Tax=Pseudomonas sp. URMO17WK12:I12 TaxID=1259797 RepID=UPI000480960E|nr:hypothetical protein [Pseudomonas sp. URMO17WK12:I12]